jgi:predicted lysophospholipase L1 biosynthesis ABC-type transport system permease subunit
MLATKTARQLHKGIGSTVTLGEGQVPTPIHARVVGLGIVPTIDSDQLAEGGVVTYAALDRALAAAPDPQAGNDDAVIRLKRGVDRRRALAQLTARQLVEPVPAAPGDVKNLDLVRAYPLWLAGFLAALGLLAVMHALLVSARRRDHQVGVLRALGMTRSQVVGAVSAQGATMCILGVVIGVPLGVALGRWTWSLSAHQLGVGEAVVVPTIILATVVIGGLGLLVGLGASAGWWAGRPTASSALRVA